MKQRKQYRQEAIMFGTYLLGEAPSEAAIGMYAGILAEKSDAQADRLLAYALQHPGSLALLDSAAALIRPQSELRRRLHVMFAVLECQPQYSQAFLPQPHAKPYVIVIAFTGCKAVAKALCGLVLIKALRA